MSATATPVTVTNVDEHSDLTDFQIGEFTRFRCVGYDVTWESDAFHLNCTYALEGEKRRIFFTEQLHLKVTPNAIAPDADIINNLACLFHLAAALSYYKIAAPPTFVIDYPVTTEAISFLTKLIANGLAEFAFVNNHPMSLTPVIDAQVKPSTTIELSSASASGALVPVGGGKDSAVTIDTLHRLGYQITCFSVNAFQPIRATTRVANLPLIEARRVIDHKVAKLNRSGALNGHVPVTAINSIAACLQAAILGLRFVVMSNERSADSPNVCWQGISVNHQWSKSEAFERLFQDTLERSVGENISYFSLLRPLSELAIARRFANLHEYHKVFTSCNAAFRLDRQRRAQTWCGDCSKCRFVYLILAPFLSPQELREIIGTDMFRDDRQKQGFRELLGVDGIKPLECVGEIMECRVALVAAADRDDWNGYGAREILKTIPADSFPSPADRRELFTRRPPLLIPPEFMEAYRALA